MRFRIDLKIFLFLLLFYLTKQVETYALMMIFAFIHELGHLIAGIVLGMKPDKLEIKPYGVSVSFRLTPRDYNKKMKHGNLLEVKKILVALAGPLTNLILLVVIYAIPISIFSKLMLLYANLLLILFNLLPIYPLDGGRIIKGILHILLGKMKAEKYSNTISFVTLILLTFFSSIAIYMAENIAILVIVIVLWGMYLKQDLIDRRRNKIYDLVQKSLEIK